MLPGDIKTTVIQMYNVLQKYSLLFFFLGWIVFMPYNQIKYKLNKIKLNINSGPTQNIPN